MKKLSLVFGMVLAASMAMAQENTSNVGQTGDGNSAIISQVGLQNASTVNQTSFGTTGGVTVFASANINQHGEKNLNVVSMQNAFYGFTTVDVDQIGNNNEVRLQTQNGGGTATILMDGDKNILKGLGSNLFANQKNINVFDLNISGSENTVGMSQEFGKADVDVVGSLNDIDIRQLAQEPGFNEADLDILGSENIITVDQANIAGGTGGLGNFAEIDLITGSDWNTVSVTQRGSGHESYNTITGDSNTISVSQHD